MRLLTAGSLVRVQQGEPKETANRRSFFMQKPTLRQLFVPSPFTPHAKAGQKCQKGWLRLLAATARRFFIAGRHLKEDIQRGPIEIFDPPSFSNSAPSGPGEALILHKKTEKALLVINPVCHRKGGKERDTPKRYWLTESAKFYCRKGLNG